MPKAVIIPAWVECPLLLVTPYLLAGVNMTIFTHRISSTEYAEDMRDNAPRYIGCHMGCCLLSIAAGVGWDRMRWPKPSLRGIKSCVEELGVLAMMIAIPMTVVLPMALLAGLFFLQLFVFLDVGLNDINRSGYPYFVHRPGDVVHLLHHFQCTGNQALRPCSG